MTPDQHHKLLETYGTRDPQSTGQRLQTGKLSAVLASGSLTDIRFGGVEVLRGISYLVRDENWGTCAAEISALDLKSSRDSHELRFSAKMQNAGSTITCFAHILLTETALTFEVTARPDKDFQTNRTGFVVLHPISGVAGKPLTITHTDGTTTKSRFPKYISPGQPFFNIRALEHQPVAGLRAKVVMDGPKFEMEDQRNWGDASFKTYVCSLLDPWPYVLKAGESFTQRVTLILEGQITTPAVQRREIQLSSPRPNGVMPQIGLSLTPEDAPETLRQVTRLNQISPRFLLGLIEAGKATQETLATYAEICAASGLPFRAEVVLSATQAAVPELAELASMVKHAGLRPEAVTVTQAHYLKSFQPGDKRPWGPSFEEMAAAARMHFPTSTVGGGMISYFTELNRKPPPIGLFDYVTHSICPIVHDASDDAVMQSLESLPHIFASARKLIGDAAYHLGPTTIAARMNPYGQSVSENPAWSRMCLAPNDPRQFGRYGAVWTLGLLAAAARARLASVTLGTLTGPRGVLRADGAFSSLGDLLLAVMPMAGQRVRAETAQGVVMVGRGNAMLLANTTNAPVVVQAKGRGVVIAAHDWQV